MPRRAAGVRGYYGPNVILIAVHSGYGERGGDKNPFRRVVGTDTQYVLISQRTNLKEGRLAEVVAVGYSYRGGQPTRRALFSSNVALKTSVRNRYLTPRSVAVRADVGNRK